MHEVEQTSTSAPHCEKPYRNSRKFRSNLSFAEKKAYNRRLSGITCVMLPWASILTRIKGDGYTDFEIYTLEMNFIQGCKLAQTNQLKAEPDCCVSCLHVCCWCEISSHSRHQLVLQLAVLCCCIWLCFELVFRHGESLWSFEESRESWPFFFSR